MKLSFEFDILVGGAQRCNVLFFLASFFHDRCLSFKLIYSAANYIYESPHWKKIYERSLKIFSDLE